MEESENCTPEKEEPESKFHSGDFNCNTCEQTDCIYWLLYNGEFDPLELKQLF